MRDSAEPGNLLAELRSLRFFPGSEDDFWPRFLSGVASICKPSWVLRLTRGKSADVWSLAQDFGTNLDKEQIRQALEDNLLQVAERAQSNGYAFERLRTTIPGFSQPTAIAFCVEEGKDRNGSIIIGFADRMASPQINDILIRTQLIADIPRSYFSSADSVVEAGTDQSFLDVLEIISNLTSQKKFLLSCMKLANDLSSRFQCSRVSIGWSRGEYVIPIAISHMEKFDKHMDAVTNLQALFEESLDQDEEITIPGERSPGTITAAHQKYLRVNGLKQIVTLPLRVEEKPVAVVVLERVDSFFEERDLLTLRLAMNQVATLLDNLKRTDRWLIMRAILKVKDWLGWWIGVE
ncbi:GAF domain-containing protein, partial [bacterium]|nr:GAF domain-containing protein [bacterium]